MVWAIGGLPVCRKFTCSGDTFQGRAMDNQIQVFWWSVCVYNTVSTPWTRIGNAYQVWYLNARISKHVEMQDCIKAWSKRALYCRKCLVLFQTWRRQRVALSTSSLKWVPALRSVWQERVLCTGKFFLPFLSSEVNVSPYPGTEVPGLFSFSRAVIFKSDVSCRNIGQEQLRVTQTWKCRQNIEICYIVHTWKWRQNIEIYY